MNDLKMSEFQRIDIRVGTIISAADFPQAHKPAYVLEIDFGPLGIRKSSAQITTRYTTESLTGKQVIAVVNFPKKQIGNFMSECLVLGAVNGNDVILITVDQFSENGLRIA